MAARPMALAADLAAGQGHPDRGGAVRDGQVRAVLAERSRSQVTRSGAAGRRVGLEEDRVAERDLEVIEAVADQRLQRHGVDVVRLDPLEDLVVELGGLIVRQGEQDVAEAGVRVAAMQLEVDLAEPEPPAELDAAGPAFEGLAVDLDRGGPVRGRRSLSRPRARARAAGSAVADADGDRRRAGGIEPRRPRRRSRPTRPGTSSPRRRTQPTHGRRSPAWEREAKARSSSHHRPGRDRSSRGDEPKHPRSGGRDSASFVNPEDLAHRCDHKEIPRAPLRRCRSYGVIPIQSGHDNPRARPVRPMHLPSPVRNGSGRGRLPVQANYNTSIATAGQFVDAGATTVAAAGKMADGPRPITALIESLP